jgi:hypothetical protein
VLPRINSIFLEPDMSNVSRRDAVKLAAGLAVGAGGLAAQGARGQEPKKVADPPPADTLLAHALKNPHGLMFGEEVVSKSDTGFDLVVSTARDVQGKPDTLNIRSGTMRVFRADAGVDEFTKRGGVYWKCGETEGKLQFKTLGALVMVVREKDGTVRWYSLHKDFRC